MTHEEKSDEIARLRYLAEERLDRLKMEMQTTRLLKALLTRAADALEYWNDLPDSRAKFLTLIAELRKGVG